MMSIKRDECTPSLSPVGAEKLACTATLSSPEWGDLYGKVCLLSLETAGKAGSSLMAAGFTVEPFSGIELVGTQAVRRWLGAVLLKRTKSVLCIYPDKGAVLGFGILELKFRPFYYGSQRQVHLVAESLDGTRYKVRNSWASTGYIDDPRTKHRTLIVENPRFPRAVPVLGPLEDGDF
jgi:hypothetical protein